MTDSQFDQPIVGGKRGSALNSKPCALRTLFGVLTFIVTYLPSNAAHSADSTPAAASISLDCGTLPDRLEAYRNVLVRAGTLALSDKLSVILPEVRLDPEVKEVFSKAMGNARVAAYLACRAFNALPLSDRCSEVWRWYQERSDVLFGLREQLTFDQYQKWVKESPYPVCGGSKVKSINEVLQQPPKMAKKQKVAVKTPDPKRVQECRWDLSEERNFPALQYNVKHIQPFSCEGLPPDQAVTVFLETAQMFYPSGCCPENNDGRACGGNVNRSFWFEGDLAGKHFASADTGNRTGVASIDASSNAKSDGKGAISVNLQLYNHDNTGMNERCRIRPRGFVRIVRQ